MRELVLDQNAATGANKTATSILLVQQDDGAIPWFTGGRIDPWNHVEAAMALAVAGERDAARRAFRWLADCQREDGSWFAAYARDGSVLEDHCDTNATAYVATGLHLYCVVTGDREFVGEIFGVVERALEYVVLHVDERGMLPWSIGPGDAISPHSLLAASSSVVASLRSGAALSDGAGKPRPDWLDAASKIAIAIIEDEVAFLDKSAFSMDWYYPVLAGVLDRRRARERLAKGLSRFVIPGHGVRCRSDGSWVTAAESGECAVACARAGFDRIARRILECAEALRDEDGAFRTGVVHPDRSEFPDGERTTYSAAAMILAADVLAGGPSARVFSQLS
ncbi:MAG: prenyltransferase/squalene oxidase repeat-containing protein [Acidimicrobiales bacterium]